MRHTGKKVKTKEKVTMKKKAIIITITSVLTAGAIGGYAWVSSAKQNDNVYAQVDDTFTTSVREVPVEGSPLDYSPLDNLSFAAYILENNDFRSEVAGNVKAAGVANQTIKNSCVKSGNIIYENILSLSSFVNVGEQRYRDGTNYIYRRAEKPTANPVVWKKEAVKLTKSAWAERYGKDLPSISNMIINEESVISAEYVGCEEGIYTYTYNLNITNAVVEAVKEMKTMGGLSSLPSYEKATITVKMDENWYVQSVSNYEKYNTRVGILDAGCTCNSTETFYDIGEKQTIPADVEAYFEPYKSAEASEDNSQTNEVDAISCLASAFGAQLQKGIFEFVGSVTLNDSELPLKASVQIPDEEKNLPLIVDVELGEIYIHIDEKDIYINCADNIKYKTELSTITSLVQGEGTSSALDFDVDAIMEVITNAEVVKHDGLLTVPFSLELLGIKIDININLEESTMKLASMSASTKLLENDVSITLREGENLTYKTIDDTYGNLSLAGNLSIGEDNFDIAVQYDLQNNVLYANFEDLKIALKDNVIYINSNDLKVKISVDDLLEVYPVIQKVVPSLPDLDLNNLTSLIDTDSLLESLLNNLVLQVENNIITVSTSLSIKEIDVDALLSLNIDTYKIESLEIDTVLLGKDVSLNLESDNFDKIESFDGFNDLGKLSEFVDGIVNLINQDVWSFEATGEVWKDNVKRFDIYLELQVKKTEDFFDANAIIEITGESNYYITAFIKDKTIYLNYTSVKDTSGLSLKIGYDNVLEIAKFAVELLNIDNALVDSLLSSVETDFDLDSLKEAVGEVSTGLEDIDLFSLLTSISINTQNGIDELQIDIDNNVLAKRDAGQMIISIKKSAENNKILALSVDNASTGDNESFSIGVEFNDNEFEIKSTDGNYFDCSSLVELLKSFVNCANMNSWELSGTIKATLLGIYTIDIPMEITVVKEGEKVTCYGTITIPKVAFVTEAETTTNLYFDGERIYLERFYETGVWAFKKSHQEKLSCTIDMFLQDYLKYIYFMGNFTSTITDAIDDAVSGDASSVSENDILIENVLTDYNYDGESYNITLNGEELVGSSSFNDINLSIKQKCNYIDSLTGSTKIASVVNINLEAKLNNLTFNEDGSVTVNPVTFVKPDTDGYVDGEIVEIN